MPPRPWLAVQVTFLLAGGGGSSPLHVLQAHLLSTTPLYPQHLQHSTPGNQLDPLS